MRIVFGGCVGGLLGFLFRPSVPLIGQLPFETVVTRGANLSGLDVILRSTAEQSFNYVVVGVIVGGIAGFVLSRLSAGDAGKKSS